MRSRHVKHLLEEENLQINPFRARITIYFHNKLFSKCILKKTNKQITGYHALARKKSM